MHQKKPKKIGLEASAMEVISAEPKTAEEFLRRVSFNMASSHNRHRQLYNYIREAMWNNLDQKSKNNPTFGVLIERIARMMCIIDKVERKIWADIPNMTSDAIAAQLGKNYLDYLREYRNYIETFSNLRWAEEKGSKTKTTEKVREILREEEVTKS